MLDSALQSQLRAHLERMTHSVELSASLDDSATSNEMLQFLQTVAALSDKLVLRTDAPDVRKPSFAIRQVGSSASVRFAAIPLGHEFTSLVLALLWAGGHPPKVAPHVLEQIRALDQALAFEVYMSLSCHNCPDVVQALSLMALVNPRVQVVVVDGGLFQAEVTERGVLAVPTVFLNGTPFGSGRMSLEEILAKLDGASTKKAAQTLDEKAPFDVLVVGAGPAGAAAAVYAARKGIRTGMVALRVGGQTNDTLGIENYISVLETTGPRFAADLEAHVRHYGVDVMTPFTASGITPAGADGLTQVHFEGGGTLSARSVILATGARWRNINVPGEQEYRNRGVAYCPHCDGPLFKGKRVAVVGGGNSGVEAAIDLAGLTAHVDVLEFGDQLRADAVLVRKLMSLPNVTVHTGAQTTEIVGDGQRVRGLRYLDRATGAARELALEGVFVQIGLVPNTEFVKGVLALNRAGELEVDARGQTSAPGVFAAGDATTVPFKQIVVAAGEGAKAALSAFDHLVRASLH